MPKRRAKEVLKMKRRCPRCGKLRVQAEFIGSACGWCDKIAAEAETALFIEGD